MRKILITIMILLFCLIIYLLLHVYGVHVPLPNSYNNMVNEQAKSSVAHDPFMNLAESTIKLRIERDSLQCIVDSLNKK